MVSQSGDYDVVVNWLPSEYMAVTEMMKRRQDLNQGNYDQSLAKYKEGLYFKFTIESKKGNVVTAGLNDQAEYANRIGLLTYGYDSSFRLKAKDKELKPLTYSFQNNYGASKKAVFLVVFSKKQLQELNADSFELIYKENVLGIGQSIVSEFEHVLAHKVKFDWV